MIFNFWRVRDAIRFTDVFGGTLVAWPYTNSTYVFAKVSLPDSKPEVIGHQSFWKFQGMAHRLHGPALEPVDSMHPHYAIWGYWLQKKDFEKHLDAMEDGLWLTEDEYDIFYKKYFSKKKDKK